MPTVTIVENHERREALFARLLAQEEKTGWAHQHEVFPCVRKGAGERWLTARGHKFAPSKATALTFLRGHSAEALITDHNMPRPIFVYRGVTVSPDLWTGERDRPFIEIKSTNYSSFNFYQYVKNGVPDLTSPDTRFPMRNYFDQMANYCVALNVTKCYLMVYFLHGDYADRRKKCPMCEGPLTDFIDDAYKLCTVCGYKSKKADLWIYEVDFDPAYLKRVDALVFGENATEFYEAVDAVDENGVLEAAHGTQCYYCRTCKVGELLGCENAGKEFS